MKTLILLLLAATLSAFADPGWTLTNSVGARFTSDKVQVRVANLSGGCAASGITADDLVGLINPAIRDFWNTIPSSRLELKDGGFLDTSDTDFRDGELCLHDGNCASPPIPRVSDIVITCNTNATNFPNGSSLLALTLPTVLSGRDIKGAVIAINATNTSFSGLSRNKQIAVLAHEIGHAIGLGHTGVSANLMYYTVVPTRERLGQGDINGVTYLYPVQLDMYGFGCLTGTVSEGNSGGPTPPPTAWIGSLLLGALLALVFGKRLRPQT